MHELYIFNSTLNLSTILSLNPLSSLLTSFSDNPVSKYQLFAFSEGLIFIALLFSNVRLNLKIKNNLGHEKLETLCLSILTLCIIFFLDSSLLSLPLLNSFLLAFLANSLLNFKNGLNIPRCACHITLYLLAILFSQPFSLLVFIFILIKNLSTSENLLKVGYFFLGILSLYLTFQNAPLFDYPRDSNVTPYSPLIHAGVVNFGIDNMPFTLLYNSYLGLRENSYLVLLLLSAALILFQMRHPRTNKIKTAFVCMFCLLSIYLNHTILIQLIDIPLLRFLPGYAFLPLPVLVPILIAVFILDIFNIHRKEFKYFLPTALCFLLIFNSPQVSQNVYALNRDFSDKKNTIPTIEPHYTPSNYLLKTYKGLKLTLEESQYNSIDISPNCTATSSAFPEEAARALDGDTNTRWATKNPQQAGDYFEIACKETIELDKILLELGNNGTDFARGFSITTDSTSILNLEDWLGPIRKTKSGLPYFGPQKEIELAFDKPLRFKTIRFTVNRGDNTFDWSIGEVKFYEEKSKA